MEVEDIKKILGTDQEFRVGNRVIDLYPIRLVDWPRFSEVLMAIQLTSLQEVFRYTDAPIALEKLFKLVTRHEETPELYFDMTETEYKDLRSKVMGQNDLDFDKVKTESKSKN